jgi:putative phosphopantetheine-binding protein
MKEQIKSIIKDIESICADDTIKNFYIGKTDNVNDRECEHINNGYTNFSIIAKGASDIINYTETALISYFRTSPLKSKLVNINNGGGGNAEADTLYIVFVRCNVEDISEVDGRLMPPNYPINIK